MVPELLSRLADHDLPATFFVEGLNAELYPDTLHSIDAAGHELAYHAWRHEDWASLSADDQAANLNRGLAAFRNLGIELTGLRPPGGLLGEGGATVIRDSGLTYCSPAGSGAGVDDGIALLPFQWRHVDAASLLPPLAPVREQITGSPDPLTPEAFTEYLDSEINRFQTEGGFLTIVLHLYLIHHWLGEKSLGSILNKLSSPQTEGDLWIAPMRDAASHVLEHPGDLGEGTTLDTTSWA